MHHLVLELVERVARHLAPGLTLGVHRVQARLDVQRLDQRIRIEEQLQDRVQQAADPPERRTVRLVERLLLEREVGQLRRCVGRLRAAELLEQIGPHAAWVEELLELDRRHLVNLLLGVVDAALLADARADLFHDLLDVDRVGAHVEVSHR